METMACPSCKEPLSQVFLVCPTCKADIPPVYREPGIVLKKELEPVLPNANLVEFRRTCQVCGKIWHSLVTREEEIITSQETDNLLAVGGALQGCGTCGALGTETQAQARGNADAHQSELRRLQSCPECSSAHYLEELINHAN